MKVAEIANGHVPSRWAHSINVVNHAVAFAKCGYDVELFTVERFYETKNRRNSALSDWYDLNGVQVNFVREPGWMYYLETPLVQRVLGFLNRVGDYRYFPISPAGKKIAEQVKARGIQFCHCRSNDVIVPLLDRGLPLVWETHNPEVRERQPVIKKILSRRNDPNFRALFTQNEMVRDAYLALDFPPEKIVVHPNAIDLELYRPEKVAPLKPGIRAELGTGKADFVVAYTGHLYTGRGIEDLITAASILPEVMFWVIGGNPEDVTRYQQQASEHSLENMRFTGFIQKGKIPAYAHAADVLAMPYTRDTPTWREMSPIKMYEYLAAGRPVIATDLPNLSAVIKPGVNGLLVSEKNGSAIADAVRSLMNDRASIEKMGKTNYALAAEHAISRRIQSIMSFAE